MFCYYSLSGLLAFSALVQWKEHALWNQVELGLKFSSSSTVEWSNFRQVIQYAINVRAEDSLDRPIHSLISCHCLFKVRYQKIPVPCFMLQYPSACVSNVFNIQFWIPHLKFTKFLYLDIRV